MCAQCSVKPDAGKEKPELLAPAGGFSRGIHALRSGADAIYLGLKSFSARSSAENFDFDTLRRLLNFARSFDPPRRIYVAVNTVIREQELARLEEQLYFLDSLRIDGIIMQDLGVCALIRNRYPALPLMASTQMTVHNADGARVLQELGFRQVILARELSIAEIAAIKRAVPGLKLEVFIHGALCYGVSGACFASHQLTGRSGNRGVCAQICRNWFSRKEENLYPFSCRDLSAGNQLAALAEAGVSSFKIEGRMKSQEYAAAVTAYYRNLIDTCRISPELERKARLVFSRETTEGRFKDRKSGHLTPRFPGHRGVLCGTAHRKGEQVEVSLEKSLNPGDGLMMLPTTIPGDPHFFAVPARNGRGASRFRIPVPRDTTFPTPVYQVSSRDRRLPDYRQTGYAAYRIPVHLSLRFAIDQTTGTTHLIINAYRKDKETQKQPVFQWKSPCQVEVSDGWDRFNRQLRKVFRSSGESWFSASQLTIDTSALTEQTGAFMAPSAMKTLRRDFFTALDRFHVDHEGTSPSFSFPCPSSTLNVPPPSMDRSQLSPGQSAELPFVLPDNLPPPDTLTLWNNCSILPLPPVLWNPDPFFRSLAEYLIQNSDRRFLLGVNNIGHIPAVRRLLQSPAVGWFIDYGLLCANSGAASVWCEKLPEAPAFIVAWHEGDAANNKALYAAVPTTIPLVKAGERFAPPLFISRWGGPEEGIYSQKELDLRVIRRGDTRYVVRSFE